MMSKVCKLILLMLISELAFAWNSGESYKTGRENYIAQMFSRGEAEYAVINLKNQRLAREGMLLNVFRWAKSNKTGESVKVKTGEVKVLSTENGLITASVTRSANNISASIFKKFPGIMAGDEVELKDIQIVGKTVVAPVTTYEYSKLFSNPSRFNMSFDLSDEGFENLAEVAEIYGDLRMAKLIIEGHTSSEGNARDNQLESTQRADAIKHQLVEKYGFDPERLIALGFGETEPVDEVYYPGVEKVNRRIVFRVSFE